LIDVWERRLERAAALSRLWPFAREVLGFCHALTHFQREVFLRLQARNEVEASFLAQFFPRLSELVERKGPPQLAEKAREWQGQPEEKWKEALTSFWKGERNEPAEEFFSKALLQPHALLLSTRWKEKGEEPAEASPTDACPFCKHPPAVSILREQSGPDGVARSLLCSLCSLEWGFPRVLCPGCREEEPEKLPRFTAQEIPWLRAEACDTCGRYLKAVDLTRNPEAVPIIDELASTPLDVLANGEGYVKLEPNLCGI